MLIMEIMLMILAFLAIAVFAITIANLVVQNREKYESDGTNCDTVYNTALELGFNEKMAVKLSCEARFDEMNEQEIRDTLSQVLGQMRAEKKACI